MGRQGDHRWWAQYLARRYIKTGQVTWACDNLAREWAFGQRTLAMRALLVGGIVFTPYVVNQDFASSSPGGKHFADWNLIPGSYLDKLDHCYPP
jgi:hypothetical protein